MGVWHSIHVQVRGQLAGAISLLPPGGSQDSNLNPQAWPPVPLRTQSLDSSVCSIFNHSNFCIKKSANDFCCVAGQINKWVFYWQQALKKQGCRPIIYPTARNNPQAFLNACLFLESQWLVNNTVSYPLSNVQTKNSAVVFSQL